MENKRILCFSCANIFIPNDEAEELICPLCKYTVSHEKYNKIIEYAKDAIEFGYRYRSIYERDFKENEAIECAYSLVPAEQALVFIGVAALSGIIGGISYDIVQKVIRKIMNSSTNKKSKELSELNDEKNLKALVVFISDFCNDFDGVQYEVKKAILSEIFIHKQTEIMESILEKGKDSLRSSEEELKDKLKKKIMEMKDIKLEALDCESFWQKID